MSVDCRHTPGSLECLVGVVGADHPHCIYCTICGERVRWEDYTAEQQAEWRKRVGR